MGRDGWSDNGKGTDGHYGLEGLADTEGTDDEHGCRPTFDEEKSISYRYHSAILVILVKIHHIAETTQSVTICRRS